MSIIRYKYKADKNFESVKIDGTSCSVGEFKRLIVDRSTKSGGHHPRDDYDLTISNANTHEEYKDNSDQIPRNTSVIVARRIRGSVEPITPSTNQRPVVSSDVIVNEYLRPAIQTPSQHASSSPVDEDEAVPLEMLISSASGVATKVMSEDERIKDIQKDTQSRYLTSHRPNGPHVCHNCKQPGHIRTQCPLLLQSASSNSTGNTSASSSTGDHASKTDGTQLTGSGASNQPVPHPSHIVTHHSPYQLSYHPRNNHYNNRSHHRNAGHPREPPPKKTTGIPRADLLHVPHHIQGALRDQSGISVVPLQMAKYHVEKIEMKERKEAAALAQRARQFQEKGVLPPAPPPSMLPAKPSEDDTPPNLLCPLCKRVYDDAVITPCCNLSFCDTCIRTALIESEDHECPKCHNLHVAIDQINPNKFLRDHVNNWRNERQQKAAYSNLSMSSQAVVNYAPSQTLDSDFDMTLARNPSQNDADEFDVDIPSNTLPQHHAAPPVKTAPIVIKMQPPGRSPSPPPIVSTKPADMTFEDGKAPDADSAANSQMDMYSVAPANRRPEEETPKANTATLLSQSHEGEKSERMTPPSQVAPVSTILSSPPTTTTTTMAAASAPVPHYYPAPPHLTHHQPPHPHHGVIYSQQMPPTSSTGLYPMPPNFYQPAIHVPYSGAHHPGGGYQMMSVGVPPGPAGMHHMIPSHPPFAPGPHHHPVAPHHVPPNPLNGFHSAAVVPFEAANAAALHPHHHPSATFAASSISTLIAHHHQTGPQPIPTALSKDEFYMKQRYLQRIRRSSSHRRSRSRSSSVSSYSSSDSRSSSFSRRRRRSSRSRSRRRTSVRRQNSRPTSTSHGNRRERRRSSRSNSKQRRSPGHRSPSYRGRRRAAGGTSDNYSSSYRRPSPRPPRSTRDRERRRSPRPPPTLQQSTQRTIVYMHESSSSKHQSGRDRRRTKSRSRHRSRAADERVASSSSKTEQQQSKPILPSSPKTVSAEPQQIPPTLPSTIEPVVEEMIPPPSSTPVQNVQSGEKLLVDTASTIQSAGTLEEKNSNSEKKRKKHHHHHHKKHRRHRSKSQSSKSKKRHRSKDNDKKTIVDSVTAIVEAQ